MQQVFKGQLPGGRGGCSKCLKVSILGVVGCSMFIGQHRGGGGGGGEQVFKCQWGRGVKGQHPVGGQEQQVFKGQHPEVGGQQVFKCLHPVGEVCVGGQVFKGQHPIGEGGVAASV